MPSATASPSSSRARTSHGTVAAIEFARLEKIERVLAHREKADAGPAVLHELGGFLDHSGARRERCREGRDAVAMLAAEQLVHGDAERLALDVVEGDVDRRDGAAKHPAALEILASVHLLPEGAGAHRIPADEKLTVVLDRADDRALAIGHARLAPAVEPFVGLDLDDQLVPVADPDRIGVNGGYLHARPSLFFRPPFAGRGFAPPLEGAFSAGGSGSSPVGPIHHSP